MRPNNDQRIYVMDQYREVVYLNNVINGPEIVGSDVWIGREAIIMPGEKTGDGAAIGTRSVVTHDVPPYTIVAGAPARFIKKRFDDATIEKLLELKWWDLPDEEVNILLPSLVHGDMEGVFMRKAIYEIAKQILG